MTRIEMLQELKTILLSSFAYNKNGNYVINYTLLNNNINKAINPSRVSVLSNKIDAKELLNIVYDELFGLAGTDSVHPNFPIERVENQWIGNPYSTLRVKESYDRIYFEIGENAYEITLKKIKKENKNEFK